MLISNRLDQACNALYIFRQTFDLPFKTLETLFIADGFYLI
ncbi:MAG: hypothetical protein R3302_00860 [Sulfurimonadaceae bacterium]|nr:hypothetical protein [Sulfurimonadaceae bacterium]